MSANNPDAPPGQGSDSVCAKGADTPRPLKAVRGHCLQCCSGSALEVTICAAKACPLWAYRLGKKPTAEQLAELDGRKMYPLEDIMTAAEFHKNGGTVLKAIRRRCLCCSGGSKSDVRGCQHLTCPLHRYRLGQNPNRRGNAEQRRVRAARLKANTKRRTETT